MRAAGRPCAGGQAAQLCIPALHPRMPTALSVAAMPLLVRSPFPGALPALLTLWEQPRPVKPAVTRRVPPVMQQSTVCHSQPGFITAGKGRSLTDRTSAALRPGSPRTRPQPPCARQRVVKQECRIMRLPPPPAGSQRSATLAERQPTDASERGVGPGSAAIAI